MFRFPTLIPQFFEQLVSLVRKTGVIRTSAFINFAMAPKRPKNCQKLPPHPPTEKGHGSRSHHTLFSIESAAIATGSALPIFLMLQFLDIREIERPKEASG
jgi:hypothetical protein